MANGTMSVSLIKPNLSSHFSGSPTALAPVLSSMAVAAETAAAVFLIQLREMRNFERCAFMYILVLVNVPITRHYQEACQSNFSSDSLGLAAQSTSMAQKARRYASNAPSWGG